MEWDGVIARARIRWDRRRRGQTMRAKRLVWAVAFAGMECSAGKPFIRVPEGSMRETSSRRYITARAASIAALIAILESESHASS